MKEGAGGAAARGGSTGAQERTERRSIHSAFPFPFPVPVFLSPPSPPRRLPDPSPPPAVGSRCKGESHVHRGRRRTGPATSHPGGAALAHDGAGARVPGGRHRHVARLPPGRPRRPGARHRRPARPRGRGRHRHRGRGRHQGALRRPPRHRLAHRDRQGRARARAHRRRRGGVPARRHRDRARTSTASSSARASCGSTRRAAPSPTPSRCKLGEHAATRVRRGALSVRRDGDDVTRVRRARARRSSTSPGGRVEVNAGERGTAHAGRRAQGRRGGVLAGLDRRHGRPAPVARRGRERLGAHLRRRPRRAARRRRAGRSAWRSRRCARSCATASPRPRSIRPSPTPAARLEGWYWFTVPADAVVTSFALETDGQLVEGEVIEKREAAARYAAAVRAGVRSGAPRVGRRAQLPRAHLPDPGERHAPRGAPLHGDAPAVEGKLALRLPDALGRSGALRRVLALRRLGDAGSKMQLATSLDARVEAGGKLVTMRRSGYVPRADFQLEMTHAEAAPRARVALLRGGRPGRLRDAALRAGGRLREPAARRRAAIVVVVDTSAGGDEAARAAADRRGRGDPARALGRGSLRARRARRRADGALPEGGARAGDRRRASRRRSRSSAITPSAAPPISARCSSRRSSGSTAAEQPAIVYVGDGAPTAGETSSDAPPGAPAPLAHRLARALLRGRRAAPTRATICSGELTRAGGGQYLRIDDAEQATGRGAAPHERDQDADDHRSRRRPRRRRSTSRSYSATGKLPAARSSCCSRARTTRCRAKVKVKGRVGGQGLRDGVSGEVESSVATRSCRACGRRSTCGACSAAARPPTTTAPRCSSSAPTYGLMTPYTSILALDSEAAYARQGDSARRKTRAARRAAHAARSERIGRAQARRAVRAGPSGRR